MVMSSACQPLVYHPDINAVRATLLQKSPTIRLQYGTRCNICSY